MYLKAAPRAGSWALGLGTSPFTRARGSEIKAVYAFHEMRGHVAGPTGPQALLSETLSMALHNKSTRITQPRTPRSMEVTVIATLAGRGDVPARARCLFWRLASHLNVDALCLPSDARAFAAFPPPWPSRRDASSAAALSQYSRRAILA